MHTGLSIRVSPTGSRSSADRLDWRCLTLTFRSHDDSRGSPDALSEMHHLDSRSWHCRSVSPRKGNCAEIRAIPPWGACPSKVDEFRVAVRAGNGRPMTRITRIVPVRPGLPSASAQQSLTVRRRGDKIAGEPGSCPRVTDLVADRHNSPRQVATQGDQCSQTPHSSSTYRSCIPANPGYVTARAVQQYPSPRRPPGRGGRSA